MMAATTENTSTIVFTSNPTQNYVAEEPHSLVWLVTVLATLSIIIIITVIGNAFVIVAYFRDDKIRQNVANLLILNLGVTGLLTGILILTFNTVIVVEKRWPFGEIACKFWLVLDYVVSMMSVITMVLISWDRYCLVSMGLKYRTFQTMKRLRIALVISWVACTILYSTLAFGWSALSGHNNNIDYSEECEMDFSLDLGLTIAVNIIEFVIPFTLLVVLNAAVYINIKRRSMGSIGQNPVANLRKSPRPDKTQTLATTNENLHPRSPRIPLDAIAGQPTPSLNTMDVEPLGADGEGKDEAKEADSSMVKNDKRIFARHRRAAVVLAVLVGCFLVCWLPYQIASVMFAVCKFSCVSNLTWEITNNLLWCNSTINPFIYAATNVHFRRNFFRFLSLVRWKRLFKN